MGIPHRQPGRRPDRDIHKDLLRNLNRNPRIDLKNLVIQVNQGRVTFKGQLPSFDFEQVNFIERTARKIPGVRDVIMGLGPHKPDESPDKEPFIPGFPRPDRESEGQDPDEEQDSDEGEHSAEG